VGVPAQPVRTGGGAKGLAMAVGPGVALRVGAAGRVAGTMADGGGLAVDAEPLVAAAKTTPMRTVAAGLPR